MMYCTYVPRNLPFSVALSLGFYFTCGSPSSWIQVGVPYAGIHDRFLCVLEIMKDNQCSFAGAMWRFGVRRNTLRDFIGICELRVVDEEKYERVVQSVMERTGKTSVKLNESKCREALSDYRAQSNRLKSEGKLLPFYPQDDFYLGK